MQRAKPVFMQGGDILRKMFARGKGTSKHKDKMNYNGKPAPDKIYTDSTLKTYRKGWKRFCSFLKEERVNTRDMSELEPYVQPFIDRLHEKQYSAYTISTWEAAVVKVLGLSLENDQLPKRRRADVKKSRYPVKRDTKFAPANDPELLDFCRSVGLRNHKELAYIRGSDLVEKDDGSFWVNIRKGKGGKQRLAPVYGPEWRVAEAVQMMRAAGDEILFPGIPVYADIHSYGAEYACTAYAAPARPVDQIPRAERYVCKADMAGTVYDRRAMLTVSRALGHNRVDVIASSCLWALKDFY